MCSNPPVRTQAHTHGLLPLPTYTCSNTERCDLTSSLSLCPLAVPQQTHPTLSSPSLCPLAVSCRSSAPPPNPLLPVPLPSCGLAAHREGVRDPPAPQAVAQGRQLQLQLAALRRHRRGQAEVRRQGRRSGPGDGGEQPRLPLHGGPGVQGHARGGSAADAAAAAGECWLGPRGSREMVPVSQTGGWSGADPVCYPCSGAAGRDTEPGVPRARVRRETLHHRGREGLSAQQHPQAQGRRYGCSRHSTAVRGTRRPNWSVIGGCVETMGL